MVKCFEVIVLLEKILFELLKNNLLVDSIVVFFFLKICMLWVNVLYKNVF